MKQYGRIKYDLFFKKIFGKPHIVMAFLNTVLEKDLKSPITEVSFEPTDFIIKGRNILMNENKHDVIDVFCKDQENRRILIEIQKGRNPKALPRFLDYQCRNYSSQFISGSNYSEVVACYSVCWFFDLKPSHNALTETISLSSTEKNTDWNFEWKIKALYPVNLDYESLKERMIEKIEEWMLLDVVKDAEISKEIKAKLKSPTIEEAFEDLDISGYTEEQLRLAEYYEFVEEYQDIAEMERQKAAKKAVEKVKKEAEIEKQKIREETIKKAEMEKQKAIKKAEMEKQKAIKKAEEEKQKAIKETEKEKQKAIAKKMLQENLAMELIVKITGLSQEEIQKL